MRIRTARISSTAMTAHYLTQWSMNLIKAAYKNLFSTSQETHYNDQLKIPYFNQKFAVGKCLDFHGSVVEDPVLLGYDAASLHNRFIDVRRKIVPSKRRVLYPGTRHHISRNRIKFMVRIIKFTAKAQSGIDIWLYSYFNLGARWCGWSTPHPGPFTPGKTRYPLYRKLGRPQGRSGQVRKISPSPGFHPRTVQPVASLYPGPFIGIIQNT
jgi:hypothetical protein